MIVLDASAVLAFLFAESGGEMVRDELAESERRAVLGAANWAEIAGKVIDTGGDVPEVAEALWPLVHVEPVSVDDATFAGALRDRAWARSLSLGDRLCLALAGRIPQPRVLTADRAWGAVDLPIDVALIR